MKNNDFMIKYEFPIFYVRNKDVYGDYYLKSRFSLSYRCSKVVRYFSSKEALPVKVYLDLKDIKTIYRENNRLSGIYRWVNLKNGSTYIGSGTDLARRFRDYFSEKWLIKESLKNNSIIYRALLKNGYSNFRLEILEYNEKAKILEREQYYLDRLKPTYNICKVAGSSLGRVTNRSTRLKLKYVWMVRLFKEKNHNSLSEHIEFSEFIINWFGKKVKKLELITNKLQRAFEKITENKTPLNRSYEVRMKILSSSATATPVWVTDLDNGVTTSYPSARNAALALNSSNSTIMNKLKGINNKIYKGKYLIKSNTTLVEVARD
uniref:GIY-YIG intron encoded protein n=1 Tax=Annulohypoxylon stygium TaxID=326628 RepID=V5RG71_9PEZI|nr:GIY-YIG intron encoded protein [Annulohypoxylon stygium]AHB33555.1 GIY-YIG intron encoded protein [Annulohypoxylon stygium]